MKIIFAKSSVVSTLLVGLLTACPTPAPTPTPNPIGSSPAGTYTDTALSVAGKCGLPNNQPPITMAFVVGEPTAGGSITVTRNAVGGNSQTYTGTYVNPTINATLSSGGLTGTLSGTVDVSTKRFSGTLTESCSAGSSSSSTVSFNAVKP